MLLKYIEASMRQANYELLADDNSYYGEIPGFIGVYANATNLEDCRNELHEVLEDWIFIRLSKNLSIPIVDGVDNVV